MKRFGAVLVAAALLSACANPPSSPSAPAPSASAEHSFGATPAPIAATAPATATPPVETVRCVPEPAPSPFTVSDPCAGAITAVRKAVAPLGLPIARIVLQPGPFDCGDLWPGVSSPAICFGPLVISGTMMHGWVTFAGSANVAAVSLHLQLPTASSPIPSPIWVATIATFRGPPAGWVMPE
jgi:hypothetical protein